MAMTESVRSEGHVDASGRLPVESSEDHAVLCREGSAGDRWDEHHVRLPCSPQSLYPQRQPDGQSRLVQRWSMVQASHQPLPNQLTSTKRSCTNDRNM